MRQLLALLLVAATCVPAVAQSTARPRPPGTTPLEEPSAEDAAAAAALEQQQQVTTRTEGTTTYTEHRVRGKLFMVKVTPAKGPSYVLIDHKGDGQFARQDSLDSGVRVPQWTLLEF